MLQQPGLKELDIAGAATEAGTDVKARLRPAFNLEYCVPRILNRVAADGTGTALDKPRSKNALTRQLVDGSRRVIEHSNKSDASKIGLVGVQGQLSFN